MDDILGVGRASNADAVRRIKGWVREAGGFDDGVAILVSELRCHEPGCPEIETVVAVMPAGADRRQARFDCPIDRVDRFMVEVEFHA